MLIKFNKPYFTGKETTYLNEALQFGKVSGDGIFTKKCHQFFQERYAFKQVMLTTSCTSALEMAAILLDIKEGDEIIAPSYTFVSSVNAFVLRGAKIVFTDSRKDNPNIEANEIEALITKNTKAILVVHYAGIACDMDKIMQLASTHNLFVIEDAAHAIDSYYNNKPLGSIGHLAAFSFHETKNITSGEGGLLVINDEQFIGRAEVIRNMGTNRSAFLRGEVNKYEWVDIGSSFLPSDMTAAFLLAQLQSLENIQNKRKQIWNQYFEGLQQLHIQKKIILPQLPLYATNNAHMFYLQCQSLEQRNHLIEYLKNDEIQAVFHYSSLHKSPYYINKHDGRELKQSDIYTNTLLRLPLYYELNVEEVSRVIQKVNTYFLQN